MRIWSLSPKYLDWQGLLALWREGLLARKVLLGKTVGYKNHPQLERFKNNKDPLLALDSYLTYVYYEAAARGYQFSKNKINFIKSRKIIPLFKGQLIFEFKHLLTKLAKRDLAKYNLLKNSTKIQANPVFRIVNKKETERWERIKI